MTDLTYDPELPFVVIEGGQISGRFRMIDDANYWIHDVSGSGELIDTTPKPKIPEDAQHITWGKKKIAYSRHYDGLWYGWNHGRGLSEAELLTWIGDDEVTVLVRKEES